MFSGRLWNLFIDSFPKMFMQGLTVTIASDLLFTGNGDCNCGCSSAVCEHQSVKADLSLLYLDLSWYAAFSPAVYCVFWLVEDRNFTRSISSSSNCICIK